MLIGAYGLRWERSVYEWNKAARRRLLGHRPEDRATITADFSSGRGIYLLYRGDELYYIGKTVKFGRFSGRLSDHANVKKSRHGAEWDNFSWFSFDQPADEPADGGIYDLDDGWSDYDLTIDEAVSGLEAILISLLSPSGNRREEKHGTAQRWLQVTEFDWHAAEAGSV